MLPTMATSIKSLYGRLCVLIVTIVWAAYFGQMIFSFFLIFTPGKVGHLINTALHLTLALATGWYVWPKIAHLRIKEVLSSTKATIGIFFLTIALVAFSGTLLLPLAYAALSDHPDVSAIAWYSLFVFGVPFFVVLSIIGLVLTLWSRPQRVA